MYNGAGTDGTLVSLGPANKPKYSTEHAFSRATSETPCHTLHHRPSASGLGSVGVSTTGPSDLHSFCIVSLKCFNRGNQNLPFFLIPLSCG